MQDTNTITKKKIRKLKIGQILTDGTIKRGKTNQGYVFKDYESFDKKEGVCYIAELSDTQYDYEDILQECGNSEEVAEVVFDTIDWQSPGAYYNDLLNAGEVHECNNCEKSFLSYEVDKCPYCNAKKED